MHIKDFFDELEKLEPKATGIQPSFEPNKNIKACLFDIYGTLLISASGDIDESTISEENLYKALDYSGFLTMDKKTFHERGIGQKILDRFKEAIKAHHVQKNNHHQIAYPEVDIREIWNNVLKTAWDNKWIKEPENGNLTEMIFIFELLSNPVFPMPDMKEVIRQINDSGRLLGIVSNAQFYTPVIMNYFLNGQQVEDSDQVIYFNPDLTVFSYKIGKAKPDHSLFTEVRNILETKYGIQANETIFVGNDMHKDIYAAAKAGFITVLFAGDQRSLRLKENLDAVKNTKPDYIITDLKQLFTILGS